MNIIFSPDAWGEYTEWAKADKKIFLKINCLIEDISRNGFMNGMGKPEALKGRKAYSRRITQEHRLIYVGDERRNLLILSCKGHY
ncbi:MAG: Txe/YoeB family addiction module toxin [Oscillospiraceae bacterium]|nr:Txe/YoeB family addiction module toxin [Oscillospiraceae bacterium]